MANEHTISGLIDKRREIAGQIEHTQRQLRDLVADLDHVDATIRLFDPQADLGKPKQYPPRHQAFRGEMARFVLNTLRGALEPVTSLEIAKAVIEGRGLDTEDQRSVILFRKRVGACLGKLKRDGKVREVATTGPYKGWQIATQ